MKDKSITRIVRLTFSEDTIESFKKLYDKHSEAISNQPGCLGVELMRDASNPFVRATISRWEDEESLNVYRKSELFGQVWPATKVLFKEVPEVWTYRSIV